MPSPPAFQTSLFEALARGHHEVSAEPLLDGLSRRRIAVQCLPASRSEGCGSPLGQLPAPGARGIRQRGERGGSKGVVGVVFPMCCAKIPFVFPILHRDRVKPIVGDALFGRLAQRRRVDLAAIGIRLWPGPTSSIKTMRIFGASLGRCFLTGNGL
jgi:hypothetical protein